MDGSAPNLPIVNPNASKLSSSSPSFSQLSLDPRIQYQLSRLDRTIPFVPIKRYLHHTWAQTFFSRPELFFQPNSVAELQKIVTLARRCRKRLCITGFGHSPSTLTCTSSWLINLDNLSSVLEIDVGGEPGLVRFEAGISLHNLNEQLAKHGYTLPNLGSIDVQSLAGAISTGTHGSSLHHGLLSQSITSLTLLLSNSQLVTCSAEKNPELFKAALCSLGTLGVIVEMTFQAVPDFNISWTQSVHTLSEILETWPTDLWTQREYTRVWWLPYTQRGVIWRAEKTKAIAKAPSSSFYGGLVGYYVYHNLLALSNYIPRTLPWIEWFVFGMQYGFRPSTRVTSAVEPARQGLLMDCLYSQFVNEWAIPLSRGPEAISRLSAWINHDETTARIPFSSKGVWVHCPIEVRVTDTSPESATNKNNASGVRPFLDPTTHDQPTLYLNATLYRPYGKDPPCHKRYYEAFEWLMKDLGGRPHWAKNFAYTDVSDIKDMYAENPSDNMAAFMKVRDEVDPEGMFLGEWHLKNLPINPDLLNTGAEDSTSTLPSASNRSAVDTDAQGKGKGKAQAKQTSTSTSKQRRSLVEGETHRKRMGYGWGDAIMWTGAPLLEDDDEDEYYDYESDDTEGEGRDGKTTSMSTSMSASAFDMTSRTSEESFDLMAKGEASVHVSNPPQSYSFTRTTNTTSSDVKDKKDELNTGEQIDLLGDEHESGQQQQQQPTSSEEQQQDDQNPDGDFPNFNFEHTRFNALNNNNDNKRDGDRDSNPESGFGFFD